MDIEEIEMEDWSNIEVEAIVSDYFDMLQNELRGITYNKAEHRRNLRKIINRSEGSIEFKHQNISAALINNGAPYIKGYLPRWNYQSLLEDKVKEYLARNMSLNNDFEAFATQKIEIAHPKIDFNTWEVVPPEFKNVLKEKMSDYTPVRKNYLEVEQRNSSIGKTGEELVLEYEKWRLNTAGKPNLADQVVWVSSEKGDGTGFDILSKNLNGTDMYIEVKTTTLGKETPIFFSKRENDFSEANRTNFHLYRIFEIKSEAKMFQRAGSFKDFCNLEAMSFRGTF